jgi:hypothetical protein
MVMSWKPQFELLIMFYKYFQVIILDLSFSVPHNLSVGDNIYISVLLINTEVVQLLLQSILNPYSFVINKGFTSSAAVFWFSNRCSTYEWDYFLIVTIADNGFSFNEGQENIYPYVTIHIMLLVGTSKRSNS